MIWQSQEFDLTVEEAEEYAAQIGSLITISEVYGGLPSGGNAGEILIKNSDEDYDAIWGIIKNGANIWWTSHLITQGDTAIYTAKRYVIGRTDMQPEIHDFLIGQDIEEIEGTPNTLYEIIDINQLVYNLKRIGNIGENDYNRLLNKPQIDGIEINKNSTSTSLGLATASALEEKYTKPSDGIPASDLAEGVIPEVHNIPSSGSVGQALIKNSSEDYDVIWSDIDNELPAVSSTDYGKVLTVSNNGIWNAQQPIFMVTITNNNNVFSADKTFSEIIGAAKRNMIIVATYAGAYYQYCGVGSGVSFRQFVYIFTKDNIQTIKLFSVNSSNVWTQYQYQLGTYSKPDLGIPSSDLSSSVQTSLGKADMALQPENVDDSFSTTSENPVQNKVITDAFNYASQQLTNLELALDDKVDKVNGKGLSTNDFTNDDKNKLDGAATESWVQQQGYILAGDLDVYRTAAQQDTIDAAQDTAIAAIKGIYWCTYGTTTATEVADALTAGKIVAVRYTENIYELSYLGDLGNDRIYYFTNAATNKVNTLSLVQSTWTNEGSWTIPSPSSSNPSAPGTAAPGTSSLYARADHVHPKPTAGEIGAYVKPSDGIPKTDLSSAVQTSLDNADTIKGVHWCTYGTTTDVEIQAAIDAGKLPAVNRNDTVFLFHSWDSNSGYTFSSSYIGGSERVACKNGVWSAGDLKFPAAANSAPSDLGTAARGTSDRYARQDHVHNMPSAADVGAVAVNQGAANANKVLTVNSSGEVVPEDNRFVVTMTPTAQDYSGAMDKTVAEIDAAYKAGKLVLFRIMTGANSYAEIHCTAIIDAGLTYPSYGGYTIDINNNILIYAWTTYTDNGTIYNYHTNIYPLATGQWTGGSY